MQSQAIPHLTSTWFELIKFELLFQFRQYSFIGLLLVTLFFTFFVTKNQYLSNEQVIWAPYYVIKGLVTLAIFLPIVIAFFSAKAAVRDFDAGCESIVFSSGIDKTTLLMSRYIGIISTSFIFCLSCPIGMLIAWQTMSIEAIDYSQVFTSIIFACLLLIFPAILLAASILFGIGLKARSTFMIYVVAAIFLISYQVMLSVTGSPIMARPTVISEQFNQFFSLFDPLAASVFFEQSAQWSNQQRNELMPIVSNELVINRLLIISSVITLLTLIVTRFSLLLPTKFTKKKAAQATKIKQQKNTQEHAARRSPCSYASANIEQNSLSKFLAFNALIKREYLTTIKTKVFLLVTAFWALVLSVEVLNGLTYLESLGVTPLATTSRTLARFHFDVLPGFVALFLVFFTAEMVWRDKSLKINGLIDALPISNGQLFFAKVISVALMPVTFITMAIVIAIILQLYFGGTPDIAAYLSLYIYTGIPLVLLAILFIFVHCLSTHKIIGLVICVMLALQATSTLGAQLGLEHPMLRFAFAPATGYSEIAKFGATQSAFTDYMLFWASISIALAILGLALYNRGNGASLKQRTQQLYQQLAATKKNSTTTSTSDKVTKAIFTLSLILSIGAGTSLFNKIDSAGYLNLAEKHKRKAEYEHLYHEFEHLPFPRVVKAKHQVDLYPDSQHYQIVGTYTLENTGQEPISKLLINTHAFSQFSEIQLTAAGNNNELEPSATLIDHNKKLGSYLYQLNKPLLHKQQIQLNFKVERNVLSHLGQSHDAYFTKDFVYFRDLRFMPSFGFAKYLQLKNPTTREKYGLAALPEQESLEQAIERTDGDFSAHYKWSELETIISTKSSHTAFAAGSLINTWLEGERKFFHYKTDGPIRKINGYISANFDKTSDTVDGINVEVYHLAQHQAFAKEHLNAMKLTLAYGNLHFAPYPAKQLRLFEAAALSGGTGYAMPQTMLIYETVGFAVDRTAPDSFDHLTRRTAHETAHQWWGHYLDSALTEGNLLLVETLAKYTEMQILRQMYDDAYIRRLVAYEQERYFRGRGYSTEHEKALYRSSASHIVYSKGSAAMYALTEALGEQVINRALRELIEHHTYPNKPATSLDFINALYKIANIAEKPSSKLIIDRWLKHKVIDDWQVTEPSLTQLASGKYLLKLCFSNQAQTEDELGNLSNNSQVTTTQLLISTEPVSKLYNKAVDERTLQISEISAGQAQACQSFELLQKPSFVSIDPYYRSLDRDRKNNQISLVLNQSKPKVH